MGLITLVAAAMPSSGDFVSICRAIGFTPLDFVLAHLKARDDSVQFKAPASGNCHQYQLASALGCGHCSSCREFWVALLQSSLSY
nr:GABA transporter 1-like [Ipomoea batatas]GMD26915.1 GABA transporter 1-like [Ipomoea batatas]